MMLSTLAKSPQDPELRSMDAATPADALIPPADSELCHGKKAIETRPYLVNRRTVDGLEAYVIKIIKEIRPLCPNTWGTLPVHIIKFLIPAAQFSMDRMVPI